MRHQQGWKGVMAAGTAASSYSWAGPPPFVLTFLPPCSSPFKKVHLHLLKTKPNPGVASCVELSLNIWISLLCRTHTKLLVQVANESALVLFIFSHPAFPVLESGVLDVKR